MPLYEYRCERCDQKEEKLESFSAPTEHACVHCGAETGMHRQISMSAFSLAGGGWDAQGYSRTPAAKAEGATPGPAPAAAPSGGCAGGCGCHPGKP